MAFRDLIPWRSGTRNLGIQRSEHPFVALHREMNRLFDDFFRGFEMTPFGWFDDIGGTFVPRIDVTENDKEVRVTVELPGMDEKDIELHLTEDALTIRGEKREEREESDGGRYLSECSYGSFYRVIPLPAEVLTDKAEAKFKKGVLKVRLPKAQVEEGHWKKIPIETE